MRMFVILFKNIQQKRTGETPKEDWDRTVDANIIVKSEEPSMEEDKWSSLVREQNESHLVYWKV